MQRSTWLTFAICASTSACDLGREATYDAAPGDASYAPPRTDLVPAVGGDDTFDIACWNIENFPASPSTPRIVADMFASLQLDVLVALEIADTDAWDELVARLAGTGAALSSHVYSTGDYQKLGVIWRHDVMVVGYFDELFQDETSAFPRPAIALPVVYDDGVHAPRALELLGVHLKAGVEASDIARRAEAVQILDDHLQAQADAGGEDRVLILGDYNTVLGGAEGDQVMAPLQDPLRYEVLTAPLAASGTVTFLPASIMLDHVTATAALSAEFGDAAVVVPPLDEQYAGYQAGVSDHLPVIISYPLTAAGR